MLRLMEATPEGKIVAALFDGPKSYSELRSVTALSDRWLSKKLKQLSSASVVEQYGGRYRLVNPRELVEYDSVFGHFLQRRVSLEGKARLIADELSCVEDVVAVVLFGSVAKGEAITGSDIDLLIVTETESEDKLNDMVYSLMFKYDAPVEAVFQTYENFLMNLHAKTTLSFGILEGYKALYDRGGIEMLLSMKRKELLENWIYDDEATAWIQRKPTPTLKPLKTN